MGQRLGWLNHAESVLLHRLLPGLLQRTCIVTQDDEAEKSRQQGKSEIYEDRIEDNNDGCLSFFDLVRSESMGYINLVNYPYCNASRYCDFLAL